MTPRAQAAAGGSAFKQARYDAVTLDARLRYYTALARTRALTEAEDEDRLHLLRCRVLRRLLPVRVTAGPAIGQRCDESIAEPRSLLLENRADLPGVFNGLSNKSDDLLARHGTAIDLVLQETGEDPQRQTAGYEIFFLHGQHVASRRGVAQ